MLYRIYRCVLWSVVFFVKQKAAYEMRISGWSADVCSSVLLGTECLGKLPLDIGGDALVPALGQVPPHLRERGHGSIDLEQASHRPGIGGVQRQHALVGEVDGCQRGIATGLIRNVFTKAVHHDRWKRFV